MFKKVDAIRLHVDDVQKGMGFYEKALGHTSAWRRGSDSAAVTLNDSDTEIVLVQDKIAPEVDLLVDSVEESLKQFKEAGGTVVSIFDITIGKCAVVEDPWNNRLVILDLSKGPLKTDAHGNVIESA